MKRTFISLIVLLVGALACVQPATPGQTPSSTIPSPAATVSTVDSSSLWSLVRGTQKSDQAWGVDVDGQGDVYLAAFEQKPGEWFTDMAIYKFTSQGEQVWRASWGGKFQEKAFIIQVDEPYVYVGGTVYRSGGFEDSDMVVLALDAGDGHVVWEFTWGKENVYDEVDGLIVEQDAIYVSGWTTNIDTGCDVGLLKLDRDGNLIWAKSWGQAGFDEADGQMVVDDQYIYIAGRLNGVNAIFGGNALIAKFSKDSGDYVMHATWNGKGGADALGLTSDGEYLYAVGISGAQIILLKYDKDLNLVWNREWGGSKDESARSVAVDPEGNLLIVGKTASYGNGLNDIVLLKYSLQGDLLWFKTWGGSQDDTPHSLVVDGDFVYLAAETRSFGLGENDALLIKADRHEGLFPLVP
jgi:hypothetical protein